MKKLNAIIITQSKNECIQLHDLVDDTDWKNCFEGQYPIAHEFYSGTWVWWFDENGDLIGISGHDSILTATLLNPGARIFLLKDFDIKSILLKS